MHLKSNLSKLKRCVCLHYRRNIFILKLKNYYIVISYSAYQVYEHKWDVYEIRGGMKCTFKYNKIFSFLTTILECL